MQRISRGNCGIILEHVQSPPVIVHSKPWKWNIIYYIEWIYKECVWYHDQFAFLRKLRTISEYLSKMVESFCWCAGRQMCNLFSKMFLKNSPLGSNLFSFCTSKKTFHSQKLGMNFVKYPIKIGPVLSVKRADEIHAIVLFRRACAVLSDVVHQLRRSGKDFVNSSVRQSSLQKVQHQNNIDAW